MPPARARARLTADLAAVADQLGRWARWLPGQDVTRASVLPGWRVADLLAHLDLLARGLLSHLVTPADRPAEPPLAVLSRYPGIAEAIDRRTREHALELGDRLADSLAGSAVSVAAADPARVVAVVPAGTGALRAADWVAVRVVDLAVHGDDLVRSVPGAPPVGRALEASAVRHLLGWLAEAHPGQTVEIRVPPHGAVQCGVEGTALAHTRGTPPNVVETTPAVFLRLAAGRLSWAEARRDGLVTASGHRADLSDWLPLLG